MRHVWRLRDTQTTEKPLFKENVKNKDVLVILIWVGMR